MLKFVVLKLLAVLLLVTCSPWLFADIKPQKQSVLFINIDDLNDWNSVLKGHPQAQTPNIQRLADAGMTFSNTIAPSPVCFPSRTAVFSGLHPTTTGAVSNFNWGRPWRYYLRDATTLPKHLSQHGWQSLGFGKNFHSNDRPEFDRYVKRAREPKTVAGSGHKKNALGWAVIDGTEKDMPDYKVVSHAIEALNTDEPLFLSVGIYRPHVPWNLPKKYFEQFPLASFELPQRHADDLDDLPERLRLLAHNEAKFGEGFHQQLVEEGQLKAWARAYMASVAFADDQLGRMLEAWYQSPHAKDGYVFLWSDHGFMLGEKHGWGKFKPWWDSARANLIIAGPSIAAGTSNRSPISLIDLYPTVAALLNVPKPSQGLDGRSLTPLLFDHKQQWAQPVVMSHEEDGIRYDVVLDSQYRMTRTITGETELYDLQKDPHEWHNIATQKPLVVKRLSRFLSFDVPKVAGAFTAEAEDIPHQSSADFRQRGNFHYHYPSEHSTGGQTLIVELRKGKGSYIDFVVDFTELGQYALSVVWGEIDTAAALNIEAFAVADNATQASNQYIAPQLNQQTIMLDAEASHQRSGTFTVPVKQKGLHTLRFKLASDEQTKIAIDTLQLNRIAALKP